MNNELDEKLQEDSAELMSNVRKLFKEFMLKNKDRLLADNNDFLRIYLITLSLLIKDLFYIVDFKSVLLENKIHDLQTLMKIAVDFAIQVYTKEEHNKKVN